MSTSHRVIRTDAAPAPGGSYSQGRAVGGLLFTAGMGPHDPGTGQVVGTGIEEQTARVMESLTAVLAAAGASWSDVVKVTVHLQDLDRDFPGYDATYRRYVQDPFPVRTTVGSTLAGILVEIDVVAAVG